MDMFLSMRFDEIDNESDHCRILIMDLISLEKKMCHLSTFGKHSLMIQHGGSQISQIHNTL